MKEQENPTTGVTPEQIAQWKQEHGRISKIVVTCGDETKEYYVKRPSRLTLDVALKESLKSELAYAEKLNEGCWIGGDAVFAKATLENYLWHRASAQSIITWCRAGESELKEL